jgi:hypothetical protein
MRTVAYALACLVLPALWGLAASVVYDRIAARRRRRQPAGTDSADMYHI